MGDDDKGNRSNSEKKGSVGPLVVRHPRRAHGRTNPGHLGPYPHVQHPRKHSKPAPPARYQPIGGRHWGATVVEQTTSGTQPVVRSSRTIERVCHNTVVDHQATIEPNLVACPKTWLPRLYSG